MFLYGRIACDDGRFDKRLHIAEVLTLEPEFVSMLGFDHEETSEYLRYVMCVPNETMQTIARYVLQGLGSGQMMPLQE